MRTKQGIVTSTKMTKTVVVSVYTYKEHPKYKKRYRVTEKFFADPIDKTLSEGDSVVIQESRPLSKKKRWTVLEVSSK